MAKNNFVVQRKLKLIITTCGGATMGDLLGYIDFDGVVLDTETGLFKQYHILYDNTDITREEYLAKMDWNAWLEQAAVINNSIDILKNNSSRIASILTKIHSFNEGKAKIDYLRKRGVKNDVILVPYFCKKHEVVNPISKFLVDDFGGNLSGWQDNGGISIRFSVNTQKTYTDYVVVSDLEEVFRTYKD